MTGQPQNSVDKAKKRVEEAYAAEDAIQAKFSVAVQASAPRAELDAHADELMKARQVRLDAQAEQRTLAESRPA